MGFEMVGGQGLGHETSARGRSAAVDLVDVDDLGLAEILRHGFRLRAMLVFPFPRIRVRRPAETAK
jgi:hypothetical protein